MLYSFSLKTDVLPRNQYVYVQDLDRRYRFVARAGQKQHFYTNIVVDKMPQIRFNYAHTFQELSAGGKVYLTPTQVELNKGLARDRNITYRVTPRGTPRRAVITFPHYKGVGGWANPYAILDGRKLELDDTLYISFQEPYFTMGSYFLSDNYGNDPVPNAVSVINRILESYGLTARDATFLGSSKGANIAALVSEHFVGNQLILCAYSTALEYRVRNTDYAHLAVTLDYFGIGFPDKLAVLQREAEKKETHWFYSIGDQLANQGNEGMRAPNLITYACEEPHSDVIIQRWDTIRSLIQTRHP